MKDIDRRKFLQTVAAGTGAVIGLSLEDKALLAQSKDVKAVTPKAGKI